MILSIIAAIIPIVVVLLVGKILARTGVIGAEGWAGLENVTYYVLFPALIVSKLAEAELGALDWRMPVTLVAAQVLMSAGSILLGKLQRQPAERIGVFVQSGVRWNTFIALALAQDMIGGQGIALVAAAAAVMIPTANLLSILAFSWFSSEDVRIGGLLRQVLTNPLILASIIGIAINASGIALAPVIHDTLDILSEGAVALGLLASGAFIQMRNIGTPLSTVIGWSLVRLLGLPLVAGAIAFALGIPPAIFLVVLIATAVPTASNGAILARKFDSDAALAANLIAFQTVLALASFAAVLWTAEMLGLIN